MKTETSNKTRGRGHLETSCYIANICQERTDENVPGKWGGEGVAEFRVHTAPGQPQVGARDATWASDGWETTKAEGQAAGRGCRTDTEGPGSVVAPWFLPRVLSLSREQVLLTE